MLQWLSIDIRQELVNFHQESISIRLVGKKWYRYSTINNIQGELTQLSGRCGNGSSGGAALQNKL